ncbi:hypothetical protein HY990_02610 [Candidatus Micrarchaeota archaeon]|nr:hypothetical protein [Candidatus Micrarchaeota archaeon]
MNETPITIPPLTRVPTGIPGLDSLIAGGFVKNSVVLVQGDTGTTKTLFCLQYLYHGIVDHDEPGIFISFSESESAIFQHAKLFGWNIDKLIDEKKFAVIRYAPHEVANVIGEGGGSIRDTIEYLGAKRLVIDSLTAYALFFQSKYKATESILDLFEMLRKWNTTSLVTAEVSIDMNRHKENNLGFLTDGIINLYHTRVETDAVRAIEIVKMRDTSHDEKINTLVIDNDGLHVSPAGDISEKIEKLDKSRKKK